MHSFFILVNVWKLAFKTSTFLVKTKLFFCVLVKLSLSHQLNQRELLLIMNQVIYILQNKNKQKLNSQYRICLGDRWMVYGPRDYIPSVEVEVVEKRKSIPLDANEGIYLRDVKTGAVSRISGKSYMLKVSFCCAFRLDAIWLTTLLSPTKSCGRRSCLVWLRTCWRSRTSRSPTADATARAWSPTAHRTTLQCK